MHQSEHATSTELEAGLAEIRRSPADRGTLEMIVRRPQVERREVLTSGELSLAEGLVGDNWSEHAARDEKGDLKRSRQITVMNARAIALVARSKDRWGLAGDQLFVDLDLSAENLPPGTRLAVGSAVIEVTAAAHNGCGKFASRFGPDALSFVNSPLGKQLHLRGVNAKVVQPGTIRVGDSVTKLTTA